MQHFNYLMIGGGISADSAAKAIRTQDKTGTIGILCEEPVGPYRRPALSKQLWSGAPESLIWLNTEKTGAQVILNSKAISLKPADKIVTDENGVDYGYDKLLIATGIEPRKLPFGEDNVIYFRNHSDYTRLRALCDMGDEFVIIGGGFTGSELASVLADNGKNVTMIFPEDNLGARVFPIDLSVFLSEYYRDHKVTILSGDVPVSVEKDSNRYKVLTRNGRELIADGVVASIGMQPNCDLPTTGNIDCDNGIIVNEYLQTSDPDIYAAGDAANFYSLSMEKRMRCEHVDNALNMGKCAGRGMAGLPEPYEYLAFAYADMFDMGYRSIGQIDSRMDIHAVWTDHCKEGILYYRENGRVRGVLFWNMRKDLDKARNLMANKQPISNEELKVLFS